jgi:ferredoxin-type protein NapH
MKTVVPDKATEKLRRQHNYSRTRLLVLTGAFLIILLNPFFNFYLHVNFIQGWYQSLGIGKLWFVSPLEGLESLLIVKKVYLPSLIGMVIPVLLALFLGRVFCSWICPVTFILEWVDRLRRVLRRRKYLSNHLVVVKKTLWFVLIGELVVSMVLGAPLFVFWSPPGLVGREIMMGVFFHTFALEGIILLMIIVLEPVTRRFFCRSFCPLGGLLAFLGRKRKLRVIPVQEKCTDCGKCKKTCPMGLVPSEGEGTSAYCWNCGECLDHCAFGALKFHWHDRRWPYRIS